MRIKQLIGIILLSALVFSFGYKLLDGMSGINEKGPVVLLFIIFGLGIILFIARILRD